jgi:hypothetical protein
LLNASQPVRITRPDGVIQASAMHHDGNTGITDLSGRVRGRMEPRTR